MVDTRNLCLNLISRSFTSIIYHNEIILRRSYIIWCITMEDCHQDAARCKTVIYADQIRMIDRCSIRVILGHIINRENIRATRIHWHSTCSNSGLRNSRILISMRNCRYIIVMKLSYTYIYVHIHKRITAYGQMWIINVMV